LIDVSVLQIDVRWRPEGAAVNPSYDKSFQGDRTSAIEEAVAHIERNYLMLTTIKHPDCAESTRFWNFDLSDIKAALGKVATGVGSKNGASVRVDVSYQAVAISACGELPIIRVPAHAQARSPHGEAGVARLV
jgi:ATP-dependent DNA helicase RecG